MYMKSRVAGFLAASLVSFAPVQAQFAVTIMPAVLGNVVGNIAEQNAESACMTGSPPSSKEVAEARDRSTITMSQYFAAVQTGGVKSTAFYLDEKATWTDGQTTANNATIDTVVDPLPASGRSLGVKPLRFYRSPLAPNALGQWAVLDAQGATVGVYTAFFVRKAGEWKLRSLTVSQLGDKFDRAMPFCHKLGDVTKFTPTFTRWVRERREKNLEKAKKVQATANLPGADPSLASQAATNVAKAETALADAKKAEADAAENARLADVKVDVSDAQSVAIGS